MQPPRALPINNHHFWDKTDIAGQIEETPGGDDSESFSAQSICTSTDRYLLLLY
jgi:hypothetical protein